MKDFQKWHEKKITLHEKNTSQVFFREREIWWCALGANIGFEQDGKGELFRRPILVLKKFNQHVFLALPLTTKDKQGKYYIDCDVGDSIARKVIISQIRLVDSKRLLDKMVTLREDEFMKIRKTVKDML